MTPEQNIQGHAGDYPEPRDYLSPSWPYRRQAWVMQRMRRNGWSIEGLARVFGLTPAGVESYLAKDTRTRGHDHRDAAGLRGPVCPVPAPALPPAPGDPEPEPLDPSLLPYLDWPAIAGETDIWCDKPDCEQCAGDGPGVTVVSDGHALTPRSLLEGIRRHAGR